MLRRRVGDGSSGEFDFICEMAACNSDNPKGIRWSVSANTALSGEAGFLRIGSSPCMPYGSANCLTPHEKKEKKNTVSPFNGFWLMTG
jgi:hypothetical protein